MLFLDFWSSTSMWWLSEWMHFYSEPCVLDYSSKSSAYCKNILTLTWINFSIGVCQLAFDLLIDPMNFCMINCLIFQELKRLCAVLASPDPFNAHKYAYIANVCVSKFARRQGIALNMLYLATDVATITGFLFLHLKWVYVMLFGIAIHMGMSGWLVSWCFSTSQTKGCFQVKEYAFCESKEVKLPQSWK